MSLYFFYGSICQTEYASVDVGVSVLCVFVFESLRISMFLAFYVSLFRIRQG